MVLSFPEWPPFVTPDAIVQDQSAAFVALCRAYRVSKYGKQGQDCALSAILNLFDDMLFLCLTLTVVNWLVFVSRVLYESHVLHLNESDILCRDLPDIQMLLSLLHPW